MSGIHGLVSLIAVGASCVCVSEADLAPMRNLCPEIVVNIFFIVDTDLI